MKITMPKDLLNLLSVEKLYIGGKTYHILGCIKETTDDDTFQVYNEQPQEVVDKLYENKHGLYTPKFDIKDGMKKKIKSFNDMIDWAKKQKRSNSRKAVIEHFKDRIHDVNCSGGHLTANLPKDEYMDLLELRKLKK